MTNRHDNTNTRHRLAKGYSAHLKRLTVDASDEETRAWHLFLCVLKSVIIFRH